MNDLDQLQARVNGWATLTFPEADAKSRVAHLQEEVAELAEAINSGAVETAATAEECADCLLLLLQLATHAGVSLFDATEAKFKANQQRVWKPDPDGKGYWKHVDPE